MSVHLLLIGSALVLASTGASVAQTRKPSPPSALVVTNARAVPATEMAVRFGQGAVSLQRPLAPGAKATLKLPKMTDCMVSVSAVFADESIIDVEELDICREKTIRLTD